MQYNDAFRVHVRAARFAYSPVIGKSGLLWDNLESGISRNMYTRFGTLKKNIKVRTYIRGNTNMYSGLR